MSMNSEITSMQFSTDASFNKLIDDDLIYIINPETNEIEIEGILKNSTESTDSYFDQALSESEQYLEYEFSFWKVDEFSFCLCMLLILLNHLFE